MRNKETCIRLMDKLEGKLQTLRFILSRPNSDIKEFTNTINESKDIVQEVFIKTYEFRKKLDPNYSIDGFLYRSVYNQFINSYHKNKSLLKIHDEYVKYLNQIINESSESDFDRLIKLIDKSINKLPKKCKEIFKLSKTEGLTNYEKVLKLSV